MKYIQSVHPNDIDDDGGWNIHQDLQVDTTELTQSVHRFGLLTPPLVQEGDNGRLTLICGRRRLNAYRNHAPESLITCRILSSDLQEQEVLLHAIEDQKLAGPLSPIERARFYAIALSVYPLDAIERFSQLSDLGPVSKLKRQLTLLRLEGIGRNMIHSGAVSEKTGYELLNLKEYDRRFLYHLFEKLSLNQNKQKRLIDLCRIITVEKDISFRNLFTEYLEIDPETAVSNVPQFTANLFRTLYQLSHPRSCQAEVSFSRLQSELRLPAHCCLTHSPAFETDRITLSIEFKNSEELKRSWPGIRSCLN